MLRKGRFTYDADWLIAVYGGAFPPHEVHAVIPSALDMPPSGGSSLTALGDYRLRWRRERSFADVRPHDDMQGDLVPALRSQSKVGADRLGAAESRRVVERRLELQSRDRSHAGKRIADAGMSATRGIQS